MITELEPVTNLFRGELYHLKDGSKVFYQGFEPREGHIVKYFPKAQHEFALPHNTKFFNKVVSEVFNQH